MSTPENQNSPASTSPEVNVTAPVAATSVQAPKANLSLKPIAPVAPVAPQAEPATPTEAAAAASPAPVPVAPVAAAPVAPKPKLNLNVAPRSTASDLNTASAQKIPDRKYAAAVTEDDDQPSVVITVIAGLAAAAAITFAVLLFLKTK